MPLSVPEQDAAIRQRDDWRRGDVIAVYVNGMWRLIRFFSTRPSIPLTHPWVMDPTYHREDYIQSNWNLSDERLTNLTVMGYAEPEPMTFGSVAEDAHEVLWCRLGRVHNEEWVSAECGQRGRAWSQLDRPKVRQHGVE